MRRKININYILGACVIVLLVLCTLSISQPLRFQSAKQEREKAVKEIRTAEERYKARHGGYSGDFQTLIKGKYLQESLLYIPYSDGKKFTLSATTIVSKSGKQIPLMECGASYEDFLNGLDENAVQELIDNADSLSA